VTTPRRRLPTLPLAAATGAGMVMVLAAALGLRLERHAVAIDLATERDLHGVAYVGSASCRACHEDHHRSWHRTFHRTMTQDASTPGAVLGDFSGAVYRYGGVAARMDRDATGAFRMTFTRQMPGAGGAGTAAAAMATAAPVTAIISRAVGSRRYQQYLTRVGDREYRLPMAFNVEERRWFHMNGAFLTPDPDDALDVPEPSSSSSSSTAAAAAVGSSAPVAARDDPPRFGGGSYDRHVARWNDNCVFCHNVAPDPGRDPASGAFRTTVAEMGIACEACHGPGGAHARANRDPLRRYLLHLAPRADPTIVNPSRLSAERSADLCGRCHGQRISDDVGRFLEHGDPFVPGDNLGLYSSPLWQGTTLSGEAEVFAARFWADGTPRLTAYEYQGLLQSPCTQRGTLTCTSCHGMHEGDPRGQLRPSAAADGACTGCHAALAGPAAAARHSHHDAAGPGARCVACHMPRIVYGVLDVHRSHRIEVPDPARDAAAGRPDACTGCHVDETRGWAAAETRRLWGAGGAPPATRAAADAAGWAGPLQMVLSGDPIARAVAADAIGRAPPAAGAAAGARRLGLLLDVMANDDYPAVRHLAWRALRRREPIPHDYDPTGPAPERRRDCAAIRAALPAAAVSAPEPAAARRLRAQARLRAIEIGE
jgi:hypothetical protein